MKARYILIICLISLLINVVSLYNLLLGIISFLLMLIIFIVTVFVKAVNKALRVEESERSIFTRQMANYGSEGITRTVNLIAIIVGLIVVYGMTVGAIFYQINNWSNLSEFVANQLGNGLPIEFMQTLSKVGWGVLLLALILVTIHLIRLMKTEAIFTNNPK